MKVCDRRSSFIIECLHTEKYKKEILPYIVSHIFNPRVGKFFHQKREELFYPPTSTPGVENFATYEYKGRIFLLMKRRISTPRGIWVFR